MNEREAFLILNAVMGIGNSTVQKLLKCYGSAVKILSLNESDLSVVPRISLKAIQNILHFPKDKFLKAEYNLMAKKKVRAITWLDDGYPEVLREIADAPVVLYMKGDLSLESALSMAIVGSRRASFYGQTVAENFAGRLAELGFTTVSGMARGIDTAAHRGALRAGGPTVAVLGCGLSHVYPLENKKLMDEIAATGVVISEFPMGMGPLPHNFPRRNRIISGLSLGVIVVEAAERSGALITADFALEQGREVFAVPGKIDHPSFRGAHGLIKQGAKLVTCVEDILEDIEPRVSAHLKAETGPSAEDRGIKDLPADLSKDEQQLYNYITDRPVHIDELTNRCGTAVPVMSVLLQLELKHLVKQLPGKLFVR